VSDWQDRFYKVIAIVTIGLLLLAIFTCSTLILTSNDSATTVLFVVGDMYLINLTWRAIQDLLIGWGRG
jgi:threonine/homoserine/homoserine lactone efflux protein